MPLAVTILQMGEAWLAVACSVGDVASVPNSSVGQSVLSKSKHRLLRMQLKLCGGSAARS